MAGAGREERGELEKAGGEREEEGPPRPRGKVAATAHLRGGRTDGHGAGAPTGRPPPPNPPPRTGDKSRPACVCVCVEKL